MMYLSDEARQSAIDEIWKDIDLISSTPFGNFGNGKDIFGNCDRVTHIVKTLSYMQDKIYEEAFDKSKVKRYRD